MAADGFFVLVDITGRFVMTEIGLAVDVVVNFGFVVAFVVAAVVVFTVVDGN